MKKAKSKTARPVKSRKPSSRRSASQDAGGSEHFFEERLREVIATFDVAHVLTSPLTDALENLLRLAGQSIGSDEASVLVRDGSRGGLKFMVAIGKVAPRLMKMRLPPGKGIAGFVFTTGQPLAVSDAAQEESFYAEVDRATGYSTQTILATPLRIEEENIGVLEFVNRIGDPPYAPFTPEEMDMAANFADAIAFLVNAHEKAWLIESLLDKTVKEGLQNRREQSDLHKWLNKVRAAPENRDLLALAISLRDIAIRGDEERKLCRDVLESIARWTEKRPSSGQSYFES